MPSELTGRELDAAVGKALGLEPDVVDYYVVEPGKWRSRLDSRESAEKLIASGKLSVECEVQERVIWPSHSRDWAAAGLVIEEMRKRGWRVQITLTDRGCSVMVDAIRNDQYRKFVSDGDADDVLVHVCRAALAAMEAEDAK